MLVATEKHSFIHIYLSRKCNTFYKRKIEVTEGQPGKQYALMVAQENKTLKHKNIKKMRIKMTNK